MTNSINIAQMQLHFLVVNVENRTVLKLRLIHHTLVHRGTPRDHLGTCLVLLALTGLSELSKLLGSLVACHALAYSSEVFLASLPF